MLKKLDRLVVLLTSIGSLILINFLAADHFLRFDLTREGIYTLSEASRSTMQDLEDRVTVTAYFSSDLPPHFESQTRYVKDLLEEYRAASNGLLSFEIIDPQREETEQDRERKKEVKHDVFGRRVRDKTEIERELEQLGIAPVEIRVIEDDAAQTKRAYLGMVIRFQEGTEVIPVVQGTAALEYNITSLVRKLVRTRVPVLGVATGKGEASLDQDLAQLSQLLGQNYELRPVEISETEPIGDEIDALLFAGTREPYSEDALEAIDQFLMQGKGAVFLVDLVSVDLETFQPTPVDHGFGPLLASYGVTVGRQLVADAESAHLNVAERRGFMVVQMPVRYPFIPQPQVMNSESPIARGLREIAVPFVAPLHLGEIEGVELLPLVRSSTRSWLEAAEAWRLNPRRDWRAEDVEVTGPYELVVQASGSLPSHFGDGESGGLSTEDGLLSRSLKEARLVVAGTSTIARNEFLGQGSAALMLNMVDWLLLDPAMLEMRTRGISPEPVDPELSDATRAFVKFGNVVGAPVLLALYGLIRRMRRQRRRSELARAASGPSTSAAGGGR